MAQFSRTIIISSHELGGQDDVTLLLTFDEQPMKGIYESYYPVVWKLSTFPTTGDNAMTVKYKNQLAFIIPQVEHDKLVSSATWVKIDLGQQTELIEKPNSAAKSFSPPTSGEANFIKATNKTGIPQNIGIAIENGGIPPPTLLLYKDIGDTLNVTAQFTPILKAYIVPDQTEKSVIWTAIPSPPIWKQNLADLKPTTHWNLNRDPTSGKLSITPKPEEIDVIAK